MASPTAPADYHAWFDDTHPVMRALFARRAAESERGAVSVGGCFPIVPDRCLKLAPTERVVHTRMFSHRDTAARISAWLA